MDITENPSLHLSKKSQPDSDWRLEEPSWMKSDVIDCWLNHWLQMKKMRKWPLVLKEGSGRLSEHLPVMATKLKGKQITQYVESKVSNMSDSDDHNANGTWCPQ